MTKAELRQQKQAERDALDSSLRAEWSELIAITLQQSFEYLHCDTLHVYLSYRSEVETLPLIRQAWQHNKRVIVPYVASPNAEMQHCEYRAEDNLTRGSYGISHPENPRFISSEELEASKTLVIVPMLAFNEKLYRLGYGKGYYDRLLRTRLFAWIGLAFSIQFTEELQVEPHDIAMQSIITEQGIARRVRERG